MVRTDSDSVRLSWTNPADPTFDHVEISLGGTTLRPPDGATSYPWPESLNTGTPYAFTVKTFDKDGTITTTDVQVTVRLIADTNPPGPVTVLATYGGFGSVELCWSNPGDPDLQYAEIICEPFIGPAQTVNAAASAPETYTWNGLAQGEIYTFSVKAVDYSGNRSAAATVTGAPMDIILPGPVTNLTAVPGDGYAVLTWTDPEDADLDYIQIECNEIAGPARLHTKASKPTSGTAFPTAQPIPLPLLPAILPAIWARP